MPDARRNKLVYGLLIALWLVIVGWQTAEHFRVRRAARAALSNRARDISTTLGLLVRAQRRFGVISRERIEAALSELLKPGDINGIALLSPAGTVVASAGYLPAAYTNNITVPAEYWTEQNVTLMNLVDLGTNIVEGLPPPIVVARDEMQRAAETNRPVAPLSLRPPPPPVPTNFEASLTLTSPPAYPPRRWPFFARPRWMSEEEFQATIRKQGVHSFLIVLSTEAFKTACLRDLWLRLIICLFATVAAGGTALAWRTFNKTAELQLRLVRASELNAHLREMNLAAAGLAHETRNPLNIIRGLAQMIAREPEVRPDIQQQAAAIVNEADKVAAQLNEFINYSRPRELRPTTIALSTAIAEVVRALNYDIEEKKVRLDLRVEPLAIEADEQLLRQALFNLLMNAIQAVDSDGNITIVTGRLNAHEGFLEIRDNGPGVPPELRKEIFKPYFTTHQRGTGLGLAVVQQITLAHGWEIECLPNEPKGAIFRITHLKLAGKR
ncbi:MAG: ATP-binding protein [Verrucomicrobiae bacterium]|nr:ATP-binding protein [Verrucomicrobiae bacterium]